MSEVMIRKQQKKAIVQKYVLVFTFLFLLLFASNMFYSGNLNYFFYISSNNI